MNKSVKLISCHQILWINSADDLNIFIDNIVIKELLKDKNLVVFSFQANIYCIIICKFFGTKY